MKLKRQLKIKNEYLDLIIGLGFDYDGLNSVESLKRLIDQLVDYAKKAKVCDDKSIIYGGENLGEPRNILLEKM